MKKKVLSLLLAVVMTFSLAVTANAAEETAQDLDGDIVILHTNDVHGAISGYAKVAALKDAYEARGAYVLLMDAGDFIQGDPTVSTSEGATAVELMNLAGYDVASMGNHEFDYGYQNLKDLEADADFTIVDANVLYNGQVAFEDNVVFTAPDGTKIGVFGLDTPETATKAHPAKIQGVTFLAGDKMFDCAQDQVDALEAEGCEYIICLGHLGIDAESTGNRSIDLLEKVEGIDVFIDGHSHSTLEDVKAAAGGTGKVGDTLVTSTGTKLESVGVVTIDADGTITVSGGTVLAAGGSSGMGMNLEAAQPCVIYGSTGFGGMPGSTQSSLIAADADFTIEDADGNAVYSGTARCGANFFLFSSADVVADSAYTLKAGDSSTEGTAQSGTVSTGMGMGGGTLLIPLLNFLDIEQQTIQAINLISFLPMACVALGLHFKNKLVKPRRTLWMIAPACAFCILGALLTKNTSSEVLKICFGVFMLLLGVWQLILSVRQMVRERKTDKESSLFSDTEKYD